MTDKVIKLNSYIGTFDYLKVHTYCGHNNHQTRPIIVFKDLINAAGFSKGQQVAPVARMPYNKQFRSLGRLTPGDKVQFSGFASHMQWEPKVAKVVWAQNVSRVDHPSTVQPVPEDTQAVVGMIITDHPKLKKRAPLAQKYIESFQRWIMINQKYFQ